MAKQSVAKESIFRLVPRGTPPKEAQRSSREENLERRIETRAEKTSERITMLADSPISILWGSADASARRMEALLEEDARLRWLVRVARYSEGANRDALWREAERVLGRLENSLAALTRAA